MSGFNNNFYASGAKPTTPQEFSNYVAPPLEAFPAVPTVLPTVVETIPTTTFVTPVSLPSSSFSLPSSSSFTPSLDTSSAPSFTGAKLPAVEAPKSYDSSSPSSSASLPASNFPGVDFESSSGFISNKPEGIFQEDLQKIEERMPKHGALPINNSSPASSFSSSPTSASLSSSAPSSLSSTSSSSIPTPPPLPPVSRGSKYISLRPYVKYGKGHTPVAFTELIKTENVAPGAGWLGWGAEKAHNAAETAKETATLAKNAMLNTGEKLEEKAVQAKETLVPVAINTAQQAKEVAKTTGEYLGEKAVQAKETLVPVAINTAQQAKEVAIATGEFAKETVVPAAIQTEKYIEANAVPAMKATANTASGLLASAVHVAASALQTGLQVGGWAAHKAVDIEQAAVETGKNLLGMAQNAMEAAKERVEEEVEELTAPVIPAAPLPPVVYRYPISRLRRPLWVKYGKGMSNLAFTLIILQEVPRSEVGTFEQHGKIPVHTTALSGQTVPSLNPLDYDAKKEAHYGLNPDAPEFVPRSVKLQ